MCETNFGWALVQLKKGFKVARRGWNGQGTYVTLKPGYPDGIACNRATAKAHGIPEGSNITYCPYLEMKTSNDSLTPWVASNADLLANDWCLVDQRDIPPNKCKKLMEICPD